MKEEERVSILNQLAIIAKEMDGVWKYCSKNPDSVNPDVKHNRLEEELNTLEEKLELLD